jgi:manganese oxidase
MGSSRRNFFQDALLFGASLFGSARLAAAEASSGEEKQKPRRDAETHGRTPEGVRVPMVTPDVPDLAFEMDGAVKVFRLKAKPMKQKIAPFKTIDAWGYNGSCPGPTIQVTRGDRVRVIFENALPESTSMHWHGLELPIEQDGVPWISQKPVPPGGSYTYEFTVHQEGTFFYHAHSAMQEMIRKSRTRHMRITISASCCKSGRCCRATPCQTRLRWSSTGSRSMGFRLRPQRP